jgi:thymidine phosphorylase
LGRVEIQCGKRSIIATLNIVKGELLSHQKAGLSEAAWHLLAASEGEKAHFRHAPPVGSMGYVRGKLYGKPFTADSARQIIDDINKGRYSDIQLSSYVTACAAQSLGAEETQHITRAMVDAGHRYDWGESRIVVDKHCVGGLPGNRTTPIVVAIVAANGLLMPKTSSRAITSPAGTADTMETLTHVALDFKTMRKVVEKEGACLAWGGSVALSPTDDVIIRVERALDLDSEGQMVASVISKKVAAGSTHVLIDIPVGPSAKVRSPELAQRLEALMKQTGEAMGLKVETIMTDGSQPIGVGIGPALEARDLLAVLQNQVEAPADLREKSLMLAACMLEMGGVCATGEGLGIARETLLSGRAWDKFQAICKAQGGLKSPPTARFSRVIEARKRGIVSMIDNRIISRLASLAGAPNAAAAGLEIHVRLGTLVESGQPLLTLHAEAEGELAYAMDFHQSHPEVLSIEEDVA